MSVKSPRSLAKKNLAKIRAEAANIAEAYRVILFREDGEWFGRGLELPHVYGNGKTVEACVENTRKGMRTLVEYLLEKRRRPPAPAAMGVRTEQVNVRLSLEEKLRLEQVAKDKGYTGISDFLRAVGLDKVA